MALEFALPDIGEGLAEATIVRWLAAVGDLVGLDEVVVEIETDKAVTEMPAPRAGVLLHRGAEAGDTLEVGSLLMVIGDEGEDWSGAAAPAAAAPASAAPIVGTLDESGEVLARPAVPQALPMVRRLAAELGVDLAGVAGTRPSGRITEADVRAAAAGDERVERVKLSATRRAIATRMEQAWREIPHVTTFASADAAALLARRRALAETTGAPVPIEALLIGAVLPALREHPEFNASLQGDTLLLRRHYDVGFAVDTPDGLLVAVVRDADTLDDAGRAAAVTRLAAGARERALAAADLSGATFTVSNIGAVGGRFGTPIIPPGTTAILSVGRADPEPGVVAGAVAVVRRFPLSLSYDHRVVDGALGRRFLAHVIGAIESSPGG